MNRTDAVYQALRGQLFEPFVIRRIESKGTFDVKLLNPAQNAVSTLKRFKFAFSGRIDFEDLQREKRNGVLCVPKSKSYAAVDFIIPPYDLFQVTVSRNHGVKGEAMNRLISTLGDDGKSIFRLFFVVPEEIYDSFQEQPYLTKYGKRYLNNLPMVCNRIQQFALKMKW
jgi:hypothetical protein